MKQLFYVLAYHDDETICYYEGRKDFVLDLEDPDILVFTEEKAAKARARIENSGESFVKAIRVHRDYLDVAAIPN